MYLHHSVLPLWDSWNPISAYHTLKKGWKMKKTWNGALFATTTYRRNIMCQNVGAFVVCVFLIKEMYAENVKKKCGSRLGVTC